MKTFAAFVCLAATIALAAGRAAAQDGPAPAEAPRSTAPMVPGGGAMFMIPRLRTTTWNVELEGAVRLVQSEGLETFPLVGRLELGVMVVREPWFLAFSATGELGGLGSRGLGGQIELTHLWGGLWGHLGVSWVRDDLAGNTAVMSAAAGWALLGLEWQRQLDSSQTLGDALFVQLRAPLGILYVLRFQERR